MFDRTQPSYVALRDVLKMRTAPVVAWVGAGMSREAGLPTWPELRKLLCGVLSDQVDRAPDPAEKRRLTGFLNTARNHKNPWVGFKALKDGLGSTSYKETIRAALARATKAQPPRNLVSLWSLGIRGMISLNIDRLATRAFTEVHPGKAFIEFQGVQSAPNAGVLKQPSAFVANVHGVLNDEPSWVFTYEEIERLKALDGYATFINACLASTVILFAGISADDVAAGGYLEALTSKGIDLGSHYWITARSDDETRRWAGRAGVQLILYDAPGNNHAELTELFADLQSYVPVDPIAPPVASVTSDADGVPDPGDPNAVAAEHPESIRAKLNDAAGHILAAHNQDAYREYADFCKKYQRAIHGAWFVTTDPPDNVLMGYKLVRRLAAGSFGEVFEADSPSGDHVAVKVLHENVRRNGEMLQAFRRGVRSMRILSDRKVQGMVPYLDATEIPACVIMEYVDGPNLKDAVLSRTALTQWDQILKLSCSLAKIIRNAHSLPERVLHRDIKPSNIMLKNYWNDPDDWQVVVLDFDLSWHRDAFEKSVISAGATSYLAPEQVTGRESTRNAAVDAFGLGMTLLYVLRGKDPSALEHLHQNWRADLLRLAGERPCSAWTSLPARFVRVIHNATMDKQAERIDMAQMDAELERLAAAYINPTAVTAADMLAEEILSQAGFEPEQYEWRPDQLCAMTTLPSGVTVSLRGSEPRREVQVDIVYEGRGDADRKRLAKFLASAVERAAAALHKSQWSDVGHSHEYQQGVVTGRISTVNAAENLVSLASGVRAACGHLRLD